MSELRTSFTAIAFLALAGTVPALADDDRCRVGNTGWMSIAAASEKARAAGYTAFEIERDDGCYEIKGTRRGGGWVKLKMHPSTGDIVRVSDRSRGDDDDRYDDDDDRYDDDDDRFDD
ncbi:PepSY domain-containing protein [Aquibium carbonis]|uniref:PepSY domain-containing protein n=1 Tax=Aquibium carbonis TaxID=2495581 RepID=A0A429YYL3_9HYPH|nr:PepSY domain-containing protein [Aquibium carbonis]RST86531.1 PepSY domain-containing protein [Aquibium carbonis]